MSRNRSRYGPRTIWGKWSLMISAVLALVLICAVGTVLVGVQLYEVTGQPTQYNNR